VAGRASSIKIVGIMEVVALIVLMGGIKPAVALSISVIFPLAS